MFDAASDARLASTRVRSVIVLERRYRALVFHREQLCWDSRYMPRPSRACDVATILLVTEGVVEVSTQCSDARVAPAIRNLLEQLAVDGILSFSVIESIQPEEPLEFSRIIEALRPAFATYAASPSLTDLQRVTGLSFAQLGRGLVRFVSAFDLFERGFRDASRLVRLRTAVLWLSNADVTTAVVAEAVGYSGNDAMARAFRDAGMPSPSVVREAVRFDRRDQ